MYLPYANIVFDSKKILQNEFSFWSVEAVAFIDFWAARRRLGTLPMRICTILCRCGARFAPQYGGFSGSKRII